MNKVDDYFTLFGLHRAFKQDLGQIKARFYQLQKNMHPDKFVDLPQQKKLAIEYAALINTAYQTLQHPLKRALYLLDLHGVDLSETDTTLPVAFLEKQMALREELAHIHESASSQKALHALKAQVDKAIIEKEHALALLLDSKPPALTKARIKVREMQFYLKLAEEIEDLSE